MVKRWQTQVEIVSETVRDPPEIEDAKFVNERFIPRVNVVIKVYPENAAKPCVA